MEVGINQKYMNKRFPKIITTNDAKMEPPKVICPKGPGPGVPEEVRSSSGDSRSRFPLACNIIKETNTWQTTKKQTNIQERLARPNTHLTCRQARCGSIHILGPCPPRVLGRTRLPLNVPGSSVPSTFHIFD